MRIHKLNISDDDNICKIANWYYHEWGTPIKKTINRLKNQPNEETLFQLILTIENEIIGTVGLCNIVNIFNVHEHLKKYKPWLGLLYVEKDHRNMGLGKILLKETEQYARSCKLSKIYLYSFTAEILYKKCGWKEIERVIYKNHNTVVMEKVI